MHSAFLHGSHRLRLHLCLLHCCWNHFCNHRCMYMSSVFLIFLLVSLMLLAVSGQLANFEYLTNRWLFEGRSNREFLSSKDIFPHLCIPKNWGIGFSNVIGSCLTAIRMKANNNVSYKRSPKKIRRIDCIKFHYLVIVWSQILKLSN